MTTGEIVRRLWAKGYAVTARQALLGPPHGIVAPHVQRQVLLDGQRGQQIVPPRVHGAERGIFALKHVFGRGRVALGGKAREFGFKVEDVTGDVRDGAKLLHRCLYASRPGPSGKKPSDSACHPATSTAA